jgi:Spy/CpxP family protein refolding chaperone
MPKEKALDPPCDKAMQEWICRENIKNLRAQLAETREEARHAMLSALLAEQEANLERLKSTPQA